MATRSQTQNARRVSQAIEPKPAPIPVSRTAEGADRWSTVAVRGGRRPDPTTGAILTPIVQSTTYVQQAVGNHKGHTYSRASNPTVATLEDAMGELEESLPAVACSTGMSAISTLLLATLKAGDHIVAGRALYGGTVRLANLVLAPLGVRTTFVDTTSPGAVGDAIEASTRLVFIETPANPTLALADIAAIAEECRRRSVLLVVDNTFMTPVLLRPLDLGADVCIQSTTKYVEGHNATVGGVLTTRNASLRDRFVLIRKTLGTIQSPFEAWLTLQGLKTLPLRIRRHSENALKVANFLESHPAVARVFYPGLASFAQRDLALRQHAGGLHGGMLSFELEGGVKAGISLMNRVRLCSLAENLGAVETLITHPVSMTHGDVPVPQRLAAGITDGLVRLSVGLEDASDVIADLRGALDGAPRPTRVQARASKPDRSKSSRRGSAPVAAEGGVS